MVTYSVFTPYTTVEDLSAYGDAGLRGTDAPYTGTTSGADGFRGEDALVSLGLFQADTIYGLYAFGGAGGFGGDAAPGGFGGDGGDGGEAEVSVGNRGATTSIGPGISIQALAVGAVGGDGGDGDAGPGTAGVGGSGGDAQITFDETALSGQHIQFFAQAFGGDFVYDPESVPNARGGLGGDASVVVRNCQINIGIDYGGLASSAFTLFINTQGGESARDAANGTATSVVIANSIYGEDGDDVVYINFANLTSDLEVGEGSENHFINNYVHLEGGDDIFVISAEVGAQLIFVDNVIYGGAGFDTFVIDHAEGVNFSLRAHSLYGFEAFRGGRGNDVLTGDGKDNNLFGAEGDDKLYGGWGDDWLDGGAGNDLLDGGSLGNDTASFLDGATNGVIADLGTGTATGVGNDTLVNIDNLSGTGFADTLRGDQYNNTLIGRGGNDILEGRFGADILIGGKGDDHLLGGNGTDTADYSGASGSGGGSFLVGVTVDLRTELIQDTRVDGFDTLISIENVIGSAYNDGIIGNSLTNRLEGGSGRDSISGGGASDILIGGWGDDLLDGGTHADILRGGGGHDRLYGGRGGDNLGGGSGNDQLYGGDGHDVMDGGSGADWLRGGNGTDRLIGGYGADNLGGGAGFDRLTGGKGADVFVFGHASHLSWDKGLSDLITDFSQVDGDLIDLSGIDANMNASGEQTFSFIGRNAFSGTAGEMRFSQNVSQTIIQMDRDGDGSADLYLTLESLVSLVSTDFVL